MATFILWLNDMHHPKYEELTPVYWSDNLEVLVAHETVEEYYEEEQGGYKEKELVSGWWD